MDLVPSDNHALQLCLGNWSAMAADLNAVIEYFGNRDEFAYVHFQTISEPLPRFNEVFIDQEGYYESRKVVAKLDEVGFSGMVIPEHVPKLQGDGQYLDHDDRSDLDVKGHGGWKERGSVHDGLPAVSHRHATANVGSNRQHSVAGLPRNSVRTRLHVCERRAIGQR